MYDLSDAEIGPTSQGDLAGPPVLPRGTSVDTTTEAAVTAVVHQMEACLNAGDPLRLYALFSDEMLIRGGALTNDSVVELETVTPTPLTGSDRVVMVGPWNVQRLPDGRVTAAVLLGLPSPETDPTRILFFIRSDGRWLIDQIANRVIIDGRELPIGVVQVVGTPPAAASE